MSMQYDWHPIFDAYFSQINIPAKDVVEEIARHDNYTRNLIDVVNEIQKNEGWQYNPKARELERQCREKVKKVAPLTPKGFPLKEKMGGLFKRSLTQPGGQIDSQAESQPPSQTEPRKFKRQRKDS